MFLNKETLILMYSLLGLINMYGNTDYQEFFDPENLHHLEIQISRREFNRMVYEMMLFEEHYPITWWDAEAAGYEIHNFKSNDYCRADLVYRGVLGEFTMEDVGIRSKGNLWSRDIPYNPETEEYQKTHFKIKFNCTWDFDEDSQEYDQLRSRRLVGLNELNLRYNNDYTQIQEQFSHEMYDRAGILLAQTGKVKLVFNIDGEIIDYGLFTSIESIDKIFIGRNFGEDSDLGYLYKCTHSMTRPDLSMESIQFPEAVGVKVWEENYYPSYDLKTHKRSEDHSMLQSFVQNFNSLEGEEFVNFIEQSMAREYFLKSMAMDFLVGNSDNYRWNNHNFYLYFHSDGRLYYIPTDLDFGLAGTSYDGGFGWIGSGSIAQSDPLEGFVNEANPRDVTAPLFDKLMEYPQFRDEYLGYVQEFIDPEQGIFSYEHYVEFYETLEPIYSPDSSNSLYPDESMYLESENHVSFRSYYQEKVNFLRRYFHEE